MEARATEATLRPILTLESFPRKINIRAYRSSDAPALSSAADNKKVWINLTDRLPHPYTLDDAHWWISNCLDRTKWRESTKLNCAVPVNYAITESTTDGSSDVVIGAIGLDFKQDVRRRTAELGYWLGEEYWGMGIMSAVVCAFVPWVWEVFGPELLKLSADVFAWNEASMKVLKKGGFEYEGRQKMAIVKNEKLGDVILLGLVRPGL